MAKINIQELHISEYVEDNGPEPPPPSFSCTNPLSLQECFRKFSHLLSSGSGAIYRLVLFETEACYTIGLLDQAAEPGEEALYQSLSKTAYEGLAWEEVMSKTRSQLKEMVEKGEFAGTPLTGSGPVTLQFGDDERIILQ